MRRILVAIAVVLTGACDRSATPSGTLEPSAAPPVAPATETQAAVPPPAFTDRVWLRADQGSAPGAIQVFLRDGTLVSDSCFETYRLSSWRLDGDRDLVWSEDGIDIRARVLSVDADSLVLRVLLRGGDAEQRFTAATVPYVCPDMPR